MIYCQEPLLQQSNVGPNKFPYLLCNVWYFLGCREEMEPNFKKTKPDNCKEHAWILVCAQRTTPWNEPQLAKQQEHANK